MKIKTTQLIMTLAMLAAFLLFVWSSIAKSMRNISHVANALEQQLKDKGLDASVKIEGDRLVIQKDVREYEIYTRDMASNWGAEMLPKVGPTTKGFSVEVYIETEDFNYPMRRPHKPTFAPQSAYREPYFYISPTILEMNGADALLNTYFGEATDKDILSKVYAEVEKALIQEYGTAWW